MAKSRCALTHSRRGFSRSFGGAARLTRLRPQRICHRLPVLSTIRVMSFGVPLCVVPVWGLRCSNFCSYFERRERRGDVAKNRSAWEKQFVNPFTSWICFS